MSIQPATERCEYIIKLVLLGDSSVGKTNLLLRFTEDNYRSTHMPTIGVDFKIKHMIINGKRVKCQLWDTAGQERFRTITETYYKGASGVALVTNGTIQVYSISDRKSFNSIGNWMAQLAQKQDESVPKVIIGNKCDLGKSERCVTFEEGEALAQKFGATFFEASAKLGTNVAQLFEKLGTLAVQRISSEEDGNETTRPVTSGKVNLTDRTKALTKRFNCCSKS